MARMGRLLAALVLAALTLLLVVPHVVVAHERRTIGGGRYDVVVGFDQEPAFVGQPNAAAIRIMKAGTQEPVAGVERTLKVQIAAGGGAAKEFSLRAVFGQSGYYVAHYIPTRAGSYIWTFSGDIEGTPINERFESGPGRFNDVESAEAIQFPERVPDALTLVSELRAVQAEVAAARTLALLGVASGIVGLIIGGLALATRRRRGDSPPATHP